MTGTHAESRQAHWWRRHPRVAALVAILLVIATGIAIALILLRAPIDGGVSSNAAGLSWRSGPVTSIPTNGATCSFVTPNGNETAGMNNDPATLRMDDAFAGSSCFYRPHVWNASNATESATFIRVHLPDLPVGWTVSSAPLTCGTELPLGFSSEIPITITMTEVATGGSAATFDAATSGVEAVPSSQFEVAMCS